MRATWLWEWADVELEFIAFVFWEAWHTPALALSWYNPPNKRGLDFVFEHSVAASNLEAAYEAYLVGYADEAGNAGVEELLGTAEIDLTAPEIANLTATPDLLSDAADFNILAVSFEVSEPLNAHGPTVFLGPTRITGCPVDPGPPIAYHCVHRVERLNDPEGIEALLFTLEEVENAVYGNVRSPEYILVTELFRSKNRRRTQRLLQVATNKNIRTAIIKPNTPAGARMAQFGGLVCMLRE